MKKIQITTIATTAEVQMISPNTYFITKAVKALFALKQLENFLEEREKLMKDNNADELKIVEIPVEILKNDIKPSTDFLNELVDALEGE